MKDIEFDYSALEGKIKQFYDTQENFAKAIPMSRTTLNQKLQNNIDFTAKNIFRMVKLLQIPSEEIGTYFFTIKVRKTERNNNTSNELVQELDELEKEN